jgi:hypothetical protein
MQLDGLSGYGWQHHATVQLRLKSGRSAVRPSLTTISEQAKRRFGDHLEPVSRFASLIFSLIQSPEERVHRSTMSRRSRTVTCG